MHTKREIEPHLSDEEIVALYHARNEQAIGESARKYGKYCHSIALAILQSEQDAEECVNDTYIRAWESMPPHKPARLSTFLGKLTRNLSISRHRHTHADKRWAGSDAVYDEMAECLPDESSTGELSDEIALKDAINGFLGSLPSKTRMVFMQRYWYFCPVTAIARNLGMSESDVKVTLLRTRQKFRTHLEKEGIVL